MHYDLSHSPFSRRGSYLQIERGFDFTNPRVMIGSARRSIWRSVNGSGFGTHFFTVRLPGDADYEVVGHHDHCAGTAAAGGSWRAAIADADTMVFRAEGGASGGGVTFDGARMMGWGSSTGERSAVVSDLAGKCTHHFKLLTPGSMTLNQRVDPDRPGKMGAAHYLFAITATPAPGHDAVEVAYRNRPHEERFDEAVPRFEEARRAAETDHARWQAKRPAVETPYIDAADFAWFMLWNQEVPTGGAMGDRRAVIMSRFWMNSVWAWDACLDAIGIGAADPQLAWDQVLLHFDHQTEDGRLPDSVSDGGPAWCYAKPPVQGWTILHLLDTIGVEGCYDHLAEVYPKLLAWTRWWTDWRCDRADGLCHYQHGNDSGWDNATVFAEPGPVISPDLQAYLALQWQALGRIALILGRKADASRHHQRAADLIDATVAALTLDGRLGHIGPDGALRPSTSTITRIPILLGRDLPEPLRSNLVADLSPGSPHLTRFGPATEATDSPHYVDDGYWRGPIWAPEAFMIFDGLRRAGEEDAAAEVARRFCALCAGPDSAMHENYDAQTGKGLRSPAYSWTAAAFIRCAHWLHTRDAATTPARRGTLTPAPA